MTEFAGWIVYNGSLTTYKFMEQVEWLSRTAMKKGLAAKAIPNNLLLPAIEDGKPVLKGSYAVDRPDFVIFWDKDICLGRHLELMGLKLFNRINTIEICDNKAYTHQILSKYGIKMPKTILSPMVYQGLQDPGDTYLEYLEDELSYPMVVKEAYGSFGAQVYLVNNREELSAKRKELLYKPHLYQELIKASYGKDVRLQVVGDEVAASMLRTSDKDFRANVTAGGTMHQFQPSREFLELAVKCSKSVGAFFSGVDMLFGEGGEPVVCEINSNAHMRNIYDCTGIDVTESITDLILREVLYGS